MNRKDITYTDHYAAVLGAMTSRGLLLAANDPLGKPNAMTIGWGAAGSIWGMPVWIVMVRPSRYTYQCIEKSDCFTVNVPGPDLDKACTICGTKSGLDLDKFAASGIHAEPGQIVHAPTIAECPIVYECQVMHRNDIMPTELVRQLQEGPYANGDYHRIYYGAIVSSRAVSGAADKLR